MKYPELVPDWVCTTPITVIIEGEGVSEDGAPLVNMGLITSGRNPMVTEDGEVITQNGANIESLTVEAYCNWQDGGKTVYSADQKVIDISGRAYFNGDIAPSIPNITGGEAYIFGMKREIHKGFKRRNPNGTVNHTEIQFK